MPESHVFYYGDNLPVMRDLASSTVDLIYLDPPFNSQRTYNMFFKESDATHSEAQRRAFDDYWRWGDDSEAAYRELTLPRTKEQRQRTPETLSRTMEMLRGILGTSDMFAYLAMMAVRLVEMRRLLKPMGSLYLHCDPTASHYLKLVLDATFSPANFRAELIWKRSTAHSDAKQGRAGYGSIHDTMLFYSKTDSWTWNQLHVPYGDKHVASKYRHVEPGTGRFYRLDNLTGPGGAAKGNPIYDVMGVKRYWRYSRERMAALIDEGRIVQTAPGRVPQYKRYLDEMSGLPLQDLWTDVDPINSQAKERLGYPTQKPVALLERIIAASSNSGDIVLDPFCGCGTTIEAAQNLGRQWIGIDVTHIAVSVLRRRLVDRFPDLAFEIRGEPEDLESARALAAQKPHGRHEFQAWIVDRIGGIPAEVQKEKHIAKKGGDHGVDGWVLYRDDPKAERSKRVVLSVKSDANPNPEMVRELAGTIAMTGAVAGALLLLEKPTKAMLAAAKSAGRYSSEVFAPTKEFDRIQILSVAEILDGAEVKVPGWNSSRQSVPPPVGAAGQPVKAARRVKPMPPRKVSEKQLELTAKKKGA